MYDDILVPVDESSVSTAVLDHASQIAHWDDASLTLLNVADTARDSVTVVDNTVVDALESEGRRVVDEASKKLDTLGVDYRTDVVQGDPAATIVDYAEKYDYDLIIMPTHGREGVSRYLLGSVSEKVVRLSSVPVLTARMREDEQLTFPYERLLVPTDGSKGATRAARHAIDLASALDATVHVLSVVDDSSLGPDVRSVISESARDEEAQTAVETVLSMAEEADVPTVDSVVHGSPDEEIRDAIGAASIHAVVMGTTGNRGVERILLGSVAEKTVRSAPVPVLTVGGGSRDN